MSRKVRLGLDLDGVIYRFQHTAIYLLKTHHKIDLSYDDWSHWDYLKEQITNEAWKWLWTDGVIRHGLFRYGSIYKGAREFLDRIQEYCDIVVLTSRRDNAKGDTIDWLAYQRLPTTEIHILGSPMKSTVLPHCDVYIDDALHNCEDLLQNTRAKVLMPSRPWNALNFTSPDTPHTGFYRTSSWQEIEDILKTTYKEINDN